MGDGSNKLCQVFKIHFLIIVACTLSNIQVLDESSARFNDYAPILKDVWNNEYNAKIIEISLFFSSSTYMYFLLVPIF